MGGDAAALADNPILFPDEETRRRLYFWSGLDADEEDVLDDRFDALIDRSCPSTGERGRSRVPGPGADRMHRYDPGIDGFAAEVIRGRRGSGRRRIWAASPSATRARRPSSTPWPEPRSPRTESGAAEALRVFTDVLEPACLSVDFSRYLAFVPAAPTEVSILADLVVSACSIYGGSWLEGAGAVWAENQALRWLADLAGPARRRPAAASSPAARSATSPPWSRPERTPQTRRTARRIPAVTASRMGGGCSSPVRPPTRRWPPRPR